MDKNNCCGYTYTLGNSKELSDLMTNIMSQDIQMLGNNAFSQVHRHFTSEIMSRKYSDYYIKVLKENR